MNVLLPSNGFRLISCQCFSCHVPNCLIKICSNSTTDTPIDSKYLPANASESKDHAINVQAVDLTKFKPANTLSAKLNHVVLHNYSA